MLYRFPFTVVTSLAALAMVACSSDTTSSATTPDISTALDSSVGTDTSVDTTALGTADTVAATTTVATVTTTLSTTSVAPPPPLTMPATTTVKPATPQTTSAPQVAPAASQFCLANESLNMSEGPMSEESDAVEQYYGGLVPTWLSQLASNAPPALQGDVSVVVNGLQTFINALQANDWDVNAVYVETNGEDAMESAQFNAASDHINNYCGF